MQLEVGENWDRYRDQIIQTPDKTHDGCDHSDGKVEKQIHQYMKNVIDETLVSYSSEQKSTRPYIKQTYDTLR